MMANIFNLILVGSMLVGCSQKHMVESLGSPTYASLKERGLRDKGEVTLVDGEVFFPDRIDLGPDSTSLIFPKIQGAVTVETAKISKIKFINRGAGAWKGLGRGMLLGLPSDGIFGGICGGVVGLTIGAKLGEKDIFHMPKNGHKLTSGLAEDKQTLVATEDKTTFVYTKGKSSAVNKNANDSPKLSRVKMVGYIGSPTYVSLKERGLREKGEVTLVDGRKYDAEIIRIGSDSTSWTNLAGGSSPKRRIKSWNLRRNTGGIRGSYREISPHSLVTVSVETDSIAFIKFDNREARRGRYLGRGFSGGIILKLLSGNDSSAIGLGIFGGAIGLLIGEITGVIDVFYMPGNDHKGTYVSSEEK